MAKLTEKSVLVKVVIPVYRNLNDEETASLANTMQILGRHSIAFLLPESFKGEHIIAQYPQAEAIRVNDKWLGTRCGIAGYNKMMKQKAFYELFKTCEYILICHTDAWVFRDELTAWCSKNYDVVAAPWPMRKKYGYFPLKQILSLRRFLTPKSKLMHQDKYNRIGNGGLSLRRVDSFIKACDEYRQEADFFDSFTDVHHAEDMFWALIPRHFHYPDAKEALKFSFDSNPWLCYQLAHKQMPMGCHGFNHKDKRAFWKNIIPVKSLSQPVK